MTRSPIPITSDGSVMKYSDHEPSPTPSLLITTSDSARSAIQSRTITHHLIHPYPIAADDSSSHQPSLGTLVHKIIQSHSADG
ncbi:uncharacterized protein H6S33_004845 [Morchella sextelata]|uniref:uncharacterized protein n=1 Tax=Morchella sextelata TaxID=1174677 RepID=UPI001D03C20B|nr:uncharacterized protein H6S33_004845 [Morchella sextelata]KAH0605623.1 hypothetical protein H6S33_004845 [Morchella sextelata]